MRRFRSCPVSRPTRPRRGWRRLVVLLVCAAFIVTPFACCFAIVAAIMTGLAEFLAAFFSLAIVLMYVVIALAYLMYVVFAMASVFCSQGPLVVITIVVVVWLLDVGELTRFFSGLLRSWGFL